MRLARTENPLALVNLLSEIDATRAPLHPLVLQAWVTLFGPSDSSGRALSVLCGLMTIGIVFWIGLTAFDRKTALWASWLCAISPLLVYYSREARMYIWLVLVTCLTWGCLLSRASAPRFWKQIAYVFCQIALVYSHPLGLLMVCALGLASLLFRREFQISWCAWCFSQFAVILGIAPWVGRYLDHAPESISGQLPLRYLLGMPIGFIGGNFLVLIICLLLIAYGGSELRTRHTGRIPITISHPAATISLVIWLLVPSVVLYVSSHVTYPVFGPPRYTLFVGPAYLILIARGLGKLPGFLGLTTALTGTMLSGVMLSHDIYRADLKADWRGLAAYLDQHEPGATIAIISADTSGMTELETARYYFGPARAVVPWSEDLLNLRHGRKPLWVSIGLQNNQPVRALPTTLLKNSRVEESVDFTRLRLMKVEFHPMTAPGD